MEYAQTIREKALEFSKQVIRFCKTLPKDSANIILTKQLIRSATSIGANYLEANDPLGEKDFLHRLRIARKEGKETLYWLELIEDSNKLLIEDINELKKKCEELIKILSSIIKKRQQPGT